MASNRPQVFPELHDPEWLRRRYIDERANTVQIAAELGCSSKAVSKALVRNDIQVRRSGPELADPISRLIDQHRRPTRTAPVLKPQPPDATQTLLLRCDYDWVDPEPNHRALLFVPPSATLSDLATELVDYFDDTGCDRTHLDAFYVRDDGTAEASWHKRTLGRCYWCAWMFDPPYFSPPEPGDPDFGGPQERCTVASVMGLHYTSWFKFDFGSSMLICVRVIGVVPGHNHQVAAITSATPQLPTFRHIVERQEHHDYDGPGAV